MPVNEDRDSSRAAARPLEKGQAGPAAATIVVSETLCRNHLSGFAEPCAEICCTIPGQHHPCKYAADVWGSDAQEVLQALATAAPTMQAEIDRLRALNGEMKRTATNVVDCWGVGKLNITAMNRFVDELRALIAKTE